MKLIKKIYFTFLLLPFLAITIANPAPSLFSVSLGTDFKTIIANVIRLVLGFSGLIALGFIILGGYQLVIARGSEEMAEKGKKTLTNAIIGLSIILLSYIILTIVVKALQTGSLGGPA